MKPGSVQTAFNTTLDQFVSKYGLSRSTNILNGFLQARKKEVWNSKHGKLVMDFVAAEAIEIYGIDEHQLVSGTDQDCRDARMCCYVVLKNYTEYSFTQIGAYFGRDKQHTAYYTYKLREVLTIPEYYRDLVARYIELEERFADFLGKL